MKKMLLMFSVVSVVCFTTTAFAAKSEKVDICHNGSIYTGSTDVSASYDDSLWEPASFVITISEEAVDKHVYNHGDSTVFELGEATVVTEVDVVEGVMTTSTQQSCTITTL